MGGANGSIHRPANELNSTWGWDTELNIFVPNFENRKTQLTRSWDPSWGQDQNNGAVVRPFNGYRFGMDSMAGGAPMWPQVNRFTLYTPYVMRDIQRNLESKTVFDAQSATGFSKWNAEQQQMLPYEHSVSQLSKVTAVPSRTSSQIDGQWVADQGYLQSLYDQGADWVVVAMANGITASSLP